jgi:hypothetical protein
LFLAFSIYYYLYFPIDNYIFLSVVPVKIYDNADVKKLNIIKENKGKSGIYR